MTEDFAQNVPLLVKIDKERCWNEVGGLLCIVPPHEWLPKVRFHHHLVGTRPPEGQVRAQV